MTQTTTSVTAAGATATAGTTGVTGAAGTAGTTGTARTPGAPGAAGAPAAGVTATAEPRVAGPGTGEPRTAGRQATAPADAAADADTFDTAAPDAADRLIAARRQRIDDLDARIIGLVRERMAVSAEIQAARIASGGRRVHLSRELDILRVYGDALGRPGTAVAMTLLELCRGTARRDHPNGS